MISSRPEIIKVHYTASTYLRVFEFNNSPLSLFLLLMAPVLAGLLIFRYLQTGKAADLEHSLPIRRETLYNTHSVGTGIAVVSGNDNCPGHLGCDYRVKDRLRARSGYTQLVKSCVNCQSAPV